MIKSTKNNANFHIFHPVFIPLYLVLVVGLIYYSSSLALFEIVHNNRQTNRFNWVGIFILLAGLLFLGYYEYNKHFDLRAFTRKEVAAETKLVYLIVNNDVYDVTPFLKKHPPGARLISQRAGTDATRHYNYHLESTKHFWRQCKVGWIVDDDVNVY